MVDKRMMIAGFKYCILVQILQAALSCLGVLWFYGCPTQPREQNMVYVVEMNIAAVTRQASRVGRTCVSQQHSVPRAILWVVWGLVLTHTTGPLV